MSETDWAYIAGMIDGEGYMGIVRHRKPNQQHVSRRGYEIEPAMTIANCNKNNLEIINEKLGGLGCLCEQRKKSKPRTITAYALHIGANAQRIILPHLIPYLIQKKKRAEILVEFLTYRSQLKVNRANASEVLAREKKYLEFEKRMREAMDKETPWRDPLYIETHKDNKLYTNARKYTMNMERVSYELPPSLQNMEKVKDE